MLITPQNSYIQTLIPNVILFASGTFLEVIRFRYGLEDGASMIELVFYKKRKRDHNSLFLSTMWLHSEKAVV